MTDLTIPLKDWPLQENRDVHLGHGFTGEERST